MQKNSSKEIEKQIKDLQIKLKKINERRYTDFGKKFFNKFPEIDKWNSNLDDYFNQYRSAIVSAFKKKNSNENSNVFTSSETDLRTANRSSEIDNESIN